MRCRHCKRPVNYDADTYSNSQNALYYHANIERGWGPDVSECSENLLPSDVELCPPIMLGERGLDDEEASPYYWLSYSDFEEDKPLGVVITYGDNPWDAVARAAKLDGVPEFPMVMVIQFTNAEYDKYSKQLPVSTWVSPEKLDEEGFKTKPMRDLVSDETKVKRQPTALRRDERGNPINEPLFDDDTEGEEWKG